MEPTVRNIVEDERAMGELERMGMMTTPVAVIGGGKEVVVGFDRAKLERALGL